MSDFLQKIKTRFPFVSDNDLEHILSIGELQLFNEGDVFIKSGEWTKKGALVVEGMTRNYIVNDKGEQITVVFATEMQAIAPYSTILFDKPAKETIEAVEPTILFVMDFDFFKKQFDTDPIFIRLYVEMLEAALVNAVLRIEDFTEKKPLDRYLRLLETHGHLIERAPLKHLASYLGITAVSLSRIRKRLSKSRN